MTLINEGTIFKLVLNKEKLFGKLLINEKFETSKIFLKKPTQNC